MKKLLLLFTMLFGGFYLSGCSEEVTDNNQNTVESNVHIISEDTITIDVNDSYFDITRYIDIQVEDKLYTPNESMIDLQDFDIHTIGEYTISVNVLDEFLQLVTKDITINVVDSLSPRVTLVGSDNIGVELGTTYRELGAVISDNYDTDLTVTIIGTVNTNQIGEYILEYKTTDSSGNVSRSIFRTVVVYEGTFNELDEDGYYISRDEVALFIYLYNRLPDNYMTKSEAGSHISNHWTSTNLASIGGDRFYNREGNLPEKSGRFYIEVDINYSGGSRNAERIVYSNDGFIFYTSDHYDSFTLYDPETRTWSTFNKYDDMFD